MNYVSFWDAARFTNWLQNGQGNGDTETGTYTLVGGTPVNNSVTRNPGANWAITSDDEWYKAAYYKGGSLNAGYWMYGTASDAITTAMANYGGSIGALTPVGQYAANGSAYGVFDMVGNVIEWTEAIAPTASDRRLRGTDYMSSALFARADWSSSSTMAQQDNDGIGFRLTYIAPIPGPPAIAVLVLGSLLSRGRRRDTTA